MARRTRPPALDPMGMEAETLYRAVASRDRRFEGRFVVAVTSTMRIT